MRFASAKVSVPPAVSRFSSKPISTHIALSLSRTESVGSCISKSSFTVITSGRWKNPLTPFLCRRILCVTLNFIPCFTKRLSSSRSNSKSVFSLIVSSFISSLNQESPRNFHLGAFGLKIRLSPRYACTSAAVISVAVIFLVPVLVGCNTVPATSIRRIPLLLKVALILLTSFMRGISNLRPCSGVMRTDFSTTGILSGASHLSGVEPVPGYLRRPKGRQEP